MVKIFLKSFFWLLKNCLYKLWSTAKTTLDRLTIFFTGVRECIRVLKYEESNKFGQYTLELLKIYEEGDEQVLVRGGDEQVLVQLPKINRC